jgi:hypothetical protein
MEGAIFTLFAAAVYFGWLWNNRGAVEERQLLASIETREDALRREALKRRAMKQLERRSKTSPHFNPNHSAEQELKKAA